METTWFWAAAVSGAACAALALVAIVAGWRRGVAELGITGAALFTISVLAGVHAAGGLSDGTPGTVAGLLTLPASAAVALPVLMPYAGLSRRLARRWRPYVLGTLLATLVAAAILPPVAVAVPAALAYPLVGVGAVGWAQLVARQWLLSRISGRRAAWIAAGASATLLASATTAVTAEPGSLRAWIVVAVDDLAVALACGALLVGYRTRRSVADVLAPLLAREPLAALEVGLAPEVVAFVDALERKDRITRDHVVRTSALAMRLAIRADLPAGEVRDVAVGALLHDIGKLVVPSDILNKPAALTDEEYATIRTHPEQGERLLTDAPSLAGVARFVRGHHERFDGKGYPDGLAGDGLPLPVALVSVSDAWDAMISTRQYRRGMARADAEQIVRDGAGTQWHPAAVELLLREVAQHGEAEAAELVPFLPRASGTGPDLRDDLDECCA